MRIRYLGAAQTVTGSQHLLEINGSTLLLDCGLYQGHRDEEYARNLSFGFFPNHLDAVILSHAHIDHSGNLPNLVKRGFRGKIYATRATARLAEIMLIDSAHVQESDVEFVNRKRAKRGEPAQKPLYSVEDAEKVPKFIKRVDYEQEFEPIPGVVARLVDAGHILGSAAVMLDIEDKGRKIRLWFSGDIGRNKLPLLCDPELPREPDIMIMESTYGDKPHRDPEEAYEELCATVLKTMKRGGKIIIPAFAVGRTQEIVYELNRMLTEGRLPHIPVYVDSPLAVTASKIFQDFSDLYDEETSEFVRNGTHPALAFPGLTYVESVEQSKSLNERREPMIIISASGMCEAGRILHHLRNNIQNPRNTVLIVGWQAPYTLGRRLADREPMVRILGEPLDRKAEVVTIGGLSAHAGQTSLVDYARAAKGKMRKLVLVHGEPKSSNPLKEILEEKKVARDIFYPGPGEIMEI